MNYGLTLPEAYKHAHKTLAKRENALRSNSYLHIFSKD